MESIPTCIYNIISYTQIYLWEVSFAYRQMLSEMKSSSFTVPEFMFLPVDKEMWTMLRYAYVFEGKKTGKRQRERS